MKNISIVSVFLCAFFVACSSSNKDSGPPPTSSDNSPPPNNNVSDGQDSGSSDSPATPGQDASSPPATLASCVAACEQKYPKAAALNKQLDANCFLGGACESVCNDLKPGKLYTPTETDAGGCDTVKADSYPITTSSQECSDCLNTNPTCCNLWISIFGSAEGRSLNDCTNSCYSKFNK